MLNSQMQKANIGFDSFFFRPAQIVVSFFVGSTAKVFSLAFL